MKREANDGDADDGGGGERQSVREIVFLHEFDSWDDEWGETIIDGILCAVILHVFFCVLAGLLLAAAIQSFGLVWF